MVNIRFRPLALLAVTLVASLALLFVVAPQTAESSTADRGGHGQSQSQSQGPKIDSQDVLDTLYQWAEAYDENDPDLMRDAFTDDATFVYASPAFEEPLVFEGIEELMGLFIDALESQHDQRRHVMSTSRIERIDRRTVQVTSYLTLLVVADPADGPIVQSTGVYRDTLVLERDGKWRIQVRDLQLDTAA